MLSAGPQALGVLSEGRHPGSLWPFSRGGGHALSDEGCDVPVLGWPLAASNLALGYDSHWVKITVESQLC